MSNQTPHEPPSRNPNSGTVEGVDPYDAQIPDNQDGDLADKKESEREFNDGEVVGPDGEHG